MPLTRSFKDTAVRRIRDDPAFKEALLGETAQAFLAGDVDTGKALLRDYIHGTIGFQALGSATGASPKSLIRRLGSRCKSADKEYINRAARGSGPDRGRAGGAAD